MSKLKRILGLDHLPSIDRERRFAYCIINELGSKEKNGVISIKELPKFIDENHIDVIAIDNIYEL